MALVGDEKIISTRIAAESESKNSILNELTIDGNSYKFEEREFTPDFSMVLPKNFEALASKFVKVKYPYEDRPKIILSNVDTTVNFTFDCMSVKPEELDERLIKYRSIIKKLHPSYVFFTQNISDLANGLKVASYDYRGSALDADIYYLVFFTDLPSGELFGSFTCPVESQTKWEPLVRQMIQTIKPQGLINK